MITALALLACSLTSLFAQSNSEYKFRQQSTVVGDRYSSEDAVPRLTMNCLAANGYGQWSLSSTAGPLIGTGALGFMPAYTTGWYKSSAPKPLHVPQDSLTTCNDLYWYGHYRGISYNKWKESFDTLKHFIETCPENVHAPNAFPEITTALTHLNGAYGGALRGPYLEWLKSVLYLDTIHENYFCSDVEEIAGSLPIPQDTSAGAISRATNISLSVIHWLIMNTTCDTPALWQEYRYSRRAQFEQWANNPQAYKLDTTLPPLSTWGLDTLFAKHFLYQHQSGVKHASETITCAAVNPNPTPFGTVLTFGMSQPAYVKVEVYDLLGNAVRAGGFEQYLGAGNHSVPIDLTTLASGSYYARIVTAYGETRTVKIVRE